MHSRSPSVTILQGDCFGQLSTLPTGMAHCCVTSPPYWGLRDYGVSGQLGLEPAVEEYVSKLVTVFREAWRVLRSDGTLWLNLGDAYTASGCGGDTGKSGLAGSTESQDQSKSARRSWLKNSAKTKESHRRSRDMTGSIPHKSGFGLGPKNLLGVPWRVAFALQADGWTLRADIIWHKPNPLPESVSDRPTKSHEYLFLFSKRPRGYYYNAEAIREAGSPDTHARYARGRGQEHKYTDGPGGQTLYRSLSHMARKAGVTPKAEAATAGTRANASFSAAVKDVLPFRNKRTVWTIPTHPFPGAHFATFPPALVEPCVLAGCPPRGMVLDPFGGSGTTGEVALRLGRSATLIELNPEYVELARRRCDVTAGLPL